MNNLQGVQGFNRYAYVNNNPYKMIDPYGHGGAHPNVPAQEKWLRTTSSDTAAVKATQLLVGFIPALGDTVAIAEMINEAALADVPLGNAATMAASKGTDKVSGIGFDDFVESGSPKKRLLKTFLDR